VERHLGEAADGDALDDGVAGLIGGHVVLLGR
jgi:hypothetical protein